jgi:hypothetical protein
MPEPKRHKNCKHCNFVSERKNKWRRIAQEAQKEVIEHNKKLISEQQKLSVIRHRYYKLCDFLGEAIKATYREYGYKFRIAELERKEK